MRSKVTLKDSMHFIGELDNFEIPIDADEAFGGMNKGPKPKGLLLTGLAGCTAMDVISILRKMKVIIKSFSVETEAELTEEHPKIFKRILITYKFSGDSLNEEKLKRAIDLSLDSYCGVSAMLRKNCPIEYKIIIN